MLGSLENFLHGSKCHRAFIILINLKINDGLFNHGACNDLFMVNGLVG